MMYVTTLNRTELAEDWAYCTCKKTVTLSETWHDAECLHCGRRWYLPGVTENLLISEDEFTFAQTAKL